MIKVYYVDLDGTLAEYSGWRGKEIIGPPVPLMLERVKNWIANGDTVKIFTARAADIDAVPYVEEWLERNGIGGLEVTNFKDHDAEEIWDDKGRQVIPNTGILVE